MEKKIRFQTMKMEEKMKVKLTKANVTQTLQEISLEMKKEDE